MNAVPNWIEMHVPQVTDNSDGEKLMIKMGFQVYLWILAQKFQQKQC